MDLGRACNQLNLVSFLVDIHMHLHEVLENRLYFLHQFLNHLLVLSRNLHEFIQFEVLFVGGEPVVYLEVRVVVHFIRH